MSEIEIKNLSNATVGRLPLPASIGEARVKPDLLHEAVVHELAARRRGTAKTKTRGEVQGSGRKLWRQKGTGRARVGEIRSPLWRKGGTVHGPVPRDYDYAFPRAKRRAALCSALAQKLRDGELTVVDQLELAAPKTKSLVQAMHGIGVDRALLVDRPGNVNLERAARNHPSFKLVAGRNLSLADLLRFPRVLITQAAFQDLAELVR